MKLVYVMLLSVVLMSTFTGCSDDDPVSSEDTRTIQIRFYPMFGDQPLTLGQEYQNVVGDMVTFTLLKFYASEFALITTTGEEVPISGIDLVDFEDASVSTNGYYAFNIQGKPGTYRGIKFSVGVPFDQNHRDVSTQSEPLGPNSGMYWAWNPGYIFCKVEGRVDSSGSSIPFVYHIGEDNRRKTIRLASLNGSAITEYVVNDNDDNVVSVNVDYSKLFETGIDPSTPLSLKDNPNERFHHLGPKDLADRTAANMAEMFSQR